MNQKYIVKKLLKNNQSEPAYKDKLDVPDETDNFMLACRKTIRDKLRDDFALHRKMHRIVGNLKRRLLRALARSFSLKAVTRIKPKIFRVIPINKLIWTTGCTFR